MGTVCNVNKGHSGRRRSARSVENIDAVRESVLQPPRKSICRLSAETSIPWSSVHCILRLGIPFKIQSRSILTAHQKAKRLKFARWYSETSEE